MPFYRFSDEFQCGVAITSFAYLAFQNFTFMINCSLNVMPFPVDLHKNFVQMPLPIWVTDGPSSPFLRNLCSKHWPETIPPKPNCFMTYIDTPLMKKVFYIAKRKWEPNIQHYSKADNLWACFKIAECRVFCHLRTLQIHPTRFNQVQSDSAGMKSWLRPIEITA